MIRERSYSKTIHLIWLKGKIPAYMEECIESICKCHSTFNIQIWLDESAKKNNKEFMSYLQCKYKLVRQLLLKDFPEIVNHRVITSTKDFEKLSPAIQSDLYRLVILELFGGVYMDTDYYFVDNIFDLLELICDAEYLADGEANYAWEETTVIPIENRKGYHCNGLLFCAKPGSPFIQECIQEVLSMPQSLRRALRVVGPDLVGTMQVKYRSRGGKGLFSIPYAHLHSLQWRDAAYIFEQDSPVVEIPEVVEVNSETHEQYRVYAVHLWNDLIDKDKSLQIKKEIDNSIENITEQKILEIIQTNIDSMQLDEECNKIVQTYIPIVIALCEYIYQVAELKQTQNIILCYRDAFLVHQVMKCCSRYQNLQLFPIWINRDVAGKLAGFEGPGYQFEPTYNAYGVVTPYCSKKAKQSINYLQNLADLRLAYKELDKLEKAIVFDLSTCHYSAQEVLSQVFPSLQLFGCYLFTFTRSTNDSYRMRDDYKAWGHITVNEHNSKIMKALESNLSYSLPAKSAGLVGDSIYSEVWNREHMYIIASAIKYINSNGEYLPTIATALKALPEKFEV